MQLYHKMLKNKQNHRRRNSNFNFKAHCWVFFILVVLTIGSISAFEFDNIKSYDSVKREVTITNAFGLGDEILKAKLNTPTIYEVSQGYNKVAEFEINGKVNYEEIIKSFKLLDLKDNGREIERRIDIKYLDYEEVDVEEIETVCDKELELRGDKFYCTDKVVGTHKETREVWRDFSNSMIKDEVKVIGLFTNVEEGDYVDWVPTIAGVEINEWAVWTESLNVGLTFYYNFDETSGDLIEKVFGVMNGTLSNMAQQQPGIINYSYNGSTTSGYVSLGTSWTPTAPFTFNVWFYPVSSTDVQILGASSCGTYCNLRIGGGDTMALGKCGVDEVSIAIPTLSIGQWYMATWVYSGTNVSYYLNGTYLGYDAYSTTFGAGNTIYLGKNHDATGGRARMDETGIWNRTLTNAEITQLYNDGNAITYRGDYVSPTVTLNTPTNNTKYTSSPQTIPFNCSASDNLVVENLTLYINGIENYTETDGVNNFTELYREVSLTEGNYNWNCRVCDNDNDCVFASSNRTLTIDSTFPTITINKPTSLEDYGYQNKSETLNWSIVETNFDSAWYDYNGTNITVYGKENQTTFTLNQGDNNLYFYVNDSAGNLNTTYHTWNYKIFENSQRYNTTTLEGSTESFILNSTISSIYSIATASLWYNGTTYTSTSSTSGSNNIFTSSLTVPTSTSATNYSFKWMFTLVNSTDTVYLNSSLNNQTVNVMNASILGSPYTVNFINFTVYDEKTLLQLNSTFAATFNYGGNSFIKTLSYQNTSEWLQSFSFGFSPVDETFLIKGQIEYGANGYETRLYTLPEQYISNTTTNVNLYLLNSSDATTFTVFVRDSSFAPVEDAIVHIQRYYSGTGTWVTTEIVETNYDGKAFGKFFTEDYYYRFLVYTDNVLQLTSTSTKVVCESLPCTITLTLPGDSTYVQYGNLTELIYGLSYSKTTETFTYSYVDSNSSAEGGRLRVIRASFGNATQTTICDTTDSSSTAVLTCDISSYSNGTYYGYAYIIRNSDSTLVQTLIISKARNIVSNVGLDGLVWSIFFILSVAMVGLRKPAVAVVFTLAGVIFVSVLGLASIPIISLVSILAIGVIILWEMKT